MKEYSIGQVLYVLLKGETSIHPVLVVEELRKKTLQGVTTEYTVEIVSGKSSRRTRVNLSELDSIVFEDIESARSHLIENATAAINDICNLAKSAAERWFQQNSKSMYSTPTPPLEEEESEDSITLENGVKARIILPPELR